MSHKFVQLGSIHGYLICHGPCPTTHFHVESGMDDKEKVPLKNTLHVSRKSSMIGSFVPFDVRLVMMLRHWTSVQDLHMLQDWHSVAQTSCFDDNDDEIHERPKKARRIDVE